MQQGCYISKAYDKTKEAWDPSDYYKRETKKKLLNGKPGKRICPGQTQGGKLW